MRGCNTLNILCPKLPAKKSPPRKTCAYCGKPAERAHSIHRDGFGVGPEVDLCTSCGSGESPTVQEIWQRIAKKVKA